MPKYVTLFWSKVQKAEGDGCWLWTGRPMTNKFGYGRGQIAPWTTVLAHRLSWMINVGPLADDECVLHHCDNPPCVRPDHLFRGDRGDNARDMAAKGRQHVQRNPAARPTCPLELKVRGERQWQARLKEEQVREIRERHHAGERRVELRRAFGVSGGCLDGILTGKTWKHIGGPIRPRRTT
jgi:(2Fe-2S) ferredoxin